MRTRFVIAALGAVLVLSQSSTAQDAAAPHHATQGHSHSRPDDHAPIGVMGDHTHGAGAVMLSFRYGGMFMDGNRSGTDRTSTAEVLRAFPASPTDMQTHMFTPGVMWAPADRVTLMAMLPTYLKSMHHVTRMGGAFTTDTGGVGDLKVSSLWRIVHEDRLQLHATVGMSFPTGSTTETDGTPMGRVRLPYPMQLGSGTFDALLGLTAKTRAAGFSFGTQANGVLRTGHNDQGYRLGHTYQVTGWAARNLAPWVSLSARLDWNQWFDVEGTDGRLNPMVVPTARADLRGGQRLDLLFGLNFLVTQGPLKGNRFALEGGVPLYQRLDGPQLETDWRITAGWQLAF